jgi:hypothetical protein
MELSTIIYSLSIIVLVVVIVIVSIIASRRQKNMQCPKDTQGPMRSVMGINVNYRDEEVALSMSKLNLERLKEYPKDAANEVVMVFLVALVKWITLPARREVPAGYCEVDWRKKTWVQVLKEAGLPTELYEEVVNIDYRFIRAFRTTYGEFINSASLPNSTERKFVDARKDEFLQWLRFRTNFVATDVEKYMTALRQYSQIDKNTSMDIKRYGEVTIMQQVCPTSATPASTTCPTLEQLLEAAKQDPSFAQSQGKTDPYNLYSPYSMQQRIAFLILIIVAIMCVVAILLEEIWRLSSTTTI